MKQLHKYFQHIVLSAIMGFFLCSCGGAAEEKPVETKDSSILDNYNNSYPNNRIHMQDSNAGADSSRIRNDSVK